MAEYASRGPTHAGPASTHSSSATHAPVPTAADRARDAIGLTTWKLDLVGRAVRDLEAAHTANDPGRWKHAKQAVDRAVQEAARSLEQARGREADASTEEKTRLEVAARALTEATETARSAEPPKGYVEITHETELRDAIRAVDEARIHSLLDELTTGELRVLRDRIASRRPGDECAAAAWALEPERRTRLTDFIRATDRDKARELVAARRSTQTSPHAIVRPAEPETIDIRLRRAFDAPDIEVAVRVAITDEDSGSRRALAERLRRYRPGMGDDIGARFVRLDAPVKAAIYSALAEERPRDAVHAPATMLAVPQPIMTVEAPRAVEPDPKDPMRAFRETRIEPRESWADDARVGTSRTAVLHYVAAHEQPIWAAIQQSISAAHWPGISPRVTIDEVQFSTVLVAELHEAIGDFSNGKLAELVYPEDAFAALAALVPAADAPWNAAVATIVIQHLQRALAPSVSRMTERFVDASDAAPLARPADLADHLAYSRPIDRIVARALTLHLSIGAGARRANRALIRPVSLHWQGSADPRLWNVVRAEQADATVEEVAAALGMPDQAYQIAVVAPLFAIPAGWALQLPEARSHAPIALRRGPVDVGDDTVEARLAQLASSSAADELALGQATPHGRAIAPAEIDRAFEESLILLADLHALLTPWELVQGITAETSWTARKRDELRHAQAGGWGPVATAQQHRLATIVTLAHRVDREAIQIASDRRADAVAPQRTVLVRLASAAATSHLAHTSEVALAEAVAEYRKGAFAGFDAAAATVDESMGAARERLDHEGANGPTDENGIAVRDTQSREQWAPYIALRSQAEDLERRAAAGEEVDPRELQRVEVAMRETNMRQRLHAMQLTLDELSTAQILAAEGLVAHVVSTSAFRSLGGAIGFLHASIGEIYKDLETDRRALPAAGVSTPNDEVAIREGAVTKAERAFAALSTEYSLGDYLQHAAEVIHDQQTRTMVVKLAVMLAASLTIGLATGGIGAAMTAEGLAGGAVADVAIEAFANGTVQYLTSAGERGAASYGSALVENLFYAGANKYAVAPALAKAGAALGVERELAALQLQETRAELALRKVGQFAEWTAKESVAVSAHAITGMALGATYAHARAAIGGHEANAQTAGDFELQALSVSVARYVHASIHASLPRFRAYAAATGAGQDLLERGLRLEAISKAGIEHADPSAAEKAVGELGQLKDRELALLESLDPSAAHGPSAEQRAEIRADLTQQRAALRGRAMLELQWQLLGLRRLAPEIWTGTAPELDHGVSEARALGMEVVIVEQAIDVTRVTIDGAPVALHVVGSVTSAATAHAAGEKPAATAYGHVWPGEVPTIAPPEVRVLFEQARGVYESFRADRFQGGSAGRVHWASFLVAHGIEVDGAVRFGGEHEVHEVTRPVEPVASRSASANVPEMGTRSGNTGGVTLARCEAALDELVANGGMLEQARRTGNLVEVKLADGRPWRIELAAPRRMAEAQMADFEPRSTGDLVWVSDRLTDDQVPRALGAIVGKALQSVGHARASAEAGALEAMFAHRDNAARAQPATGGDVKSRAIANSRLENVARIDAEIDLAMFRMGLAGADREAKLAALTPALATHVRAQLAHHVQIGVDPSAVVREDAVARPQALVRTGLATSSVLPDAPAAVHAYTAADLERVLALRAEFEIIREIDTRTAHRDQPGTNATPAIAMGETERRAPHVARARALLEELQLGGTDRAYLEARLRELAAVFPGANRDLIPAIETRLERRANAAAIHGRAEAFRAARTKLVHELVQRVKGEQPFRTERVVVGAGVSALADVATLGVGKDASMIDPAKLLVIGEADLMDRIDPAFLWGQRAAAYDRPTKAHPAFSDARGVGDGSLTEAIEDPGEFMHVGELRDALDLSRERIGMVAVPGEVHTVETFANKAKDSPTWGVPSDEYPVRVRYTLGGEELVVYAKRTDITPGPGNPNFPSPAILGTADRDAMIENNSLYSGDRLLEGREVAGKRVLVVAFGPTGAWTARTAADHGAARVDWGSLAGGELGAGADDVNMKDGDWHRGKSRGNTPSNDRVYEETMQIDRVQSARDPKANIHTTLDRIVHIDRAGDGATVTFAHGPAENVELYKATYDVIITSMGYTTKSTGPEGQRPTWGKPSVQDMIGDMQMEPSPRTSAPVTADKKTGTVRVIGFSPAENINVSGSQADRKSDQHRLVLRRQLITNQISADSPDDRVIEGVGLASRRANGEPE
ncbi:MAG: hypothetical protein ABJE66_31680 [Deltaproteobacteria bacterium]